MTRVVEQPSDGLSVRCPGDELKIYSYAWKDFGQIVFQIDCLAHRIWRNGDNLYFIAGPAEKSETEPKVGQWDGSPDGVTHMAHASLPTPSEKSIDLIAANELAIRAHKEYGIPFSMMALYWMPATGETQLVLKDLPSLRTGASQ